MKLGNRNLQLIYCTFPAPNTQVLLPVGRSEYDKTGLPLPSHIYSFKKARRLAGYVPLLTLRTIEYNESMRRILFFPIFTLFLMLFAPLDYVRADWDCRNTAIAAVPPPLPEYRCVEDAAASQFKTLRGCLRCEDDLSQPEKPYTPPNPPGGPVQPCAIGPGAGANLCKDDPRYIMRNFAALNFWSVGRGLSLAVPLAISFGAGVCLLFLLYGAYTYIMSGGDEKKITDSMHTMTYSALGLIVIVISYAIVRTILFITKINTFGF